MAEVRRIRAEEAPAVRELYREMIQELAERYPEDRIAIAEPGLDNLEAHFRDAASHGDVFSLVAEEDGAVVGFADAQVTRSPTLPGRAGSIEDVWVRPGARATGLDRRLVEEAVARLRELGAWPIFHHAAAETPDRELWEGLGFERDVVRYSLYP